MSRIRERIYIPAKAFATIEDANSLGVGTPAITQVTGKDIVGFQMVASDVVTGGWRVPFFVDPLQKLGVRVHWITGSSTGADTIDWVPTYSVVAEDAVVPDAPITALDTVIAQDTVEVATAYINKWTARGEINAAFLTRLQVEAGAFMQWAIEMNATAIGESIWFLGLELDFVRRDFVGGTGVEESLTSEV